MKKTVQVLFGLALVLANLSFANASVFAREDGFCSGKLNYNNGVYEIYTPDDLWCMSLKVNADGVNEIDDKFVLKANIDMSGVTDWRPIGTDSNPFRYEFDGGGFTISNLRITNFTPSGAKYEYDEHFSLLGNGLFGSVVNGKIHNVTLSTIEIDLEKEEYDVEVIENQRLYFVGVVAAATKDTVIENITISDSYIAMDNLAAGLNISYFKTGGLVGYSESTQINNAVVDVDIDYRNNIENSKRPWFIYVGGLVGNAYNTPINNSQYIGDITLWSNFNDSVIVGGLAGKSETYTNGTTQVNANNMVSTQMTIETPSEDGENHSTFVGGLFGIGSGLELRYNRVIQSKMYVLSESYDSYHGGLIGDATDVILYRNKFDAHLESNGNNRLYAGGLIGRLSGSSSIVESFTKGILEVEAFNAYVGGLVGSFKSINYRTKLMSEGPNILIKDNYSRMEIKSDVMSENEVEENSFDFQGISVDHEIGGLVGSTNDTSFLIEKGYFVGSFVLVQDTELYLVNALFNNYGELTEDFYNSLYFDNELISQGSLYGVRKTTALMKVKDTFVNFDFDHVWARLNEYNDGYPELRWGRYIVTFDPNNTGASFYTFGYKSAQPDPNPTKTDFDFIGWRLPLATTNYMFDDALDKDITLKAYFLTNLKVKVEGEASLQPKASNLEKAISYTETERQQEILTQLVMTLISQVNEKEKALINEYLSVLTKTYENLLFMDISLFKNFGDQKTQVNTANEPITVSFVLPQAYRNGEFLLLRIHNEEVGNVLYTYDKETFTVTFDCKDFSTFVLASEAQVEVPKEEPVISDPKEETEEKVLIPDTSDVSQINMVYLLLLGMVLIVASYKKREE